MGPRANPLPRVSVGKACGAHTFGPTLAPDLAAERFGAERDDEEAVKVDPEVDRAHELEDDDSKDRGVDGRRRPAGRHRARGRDDPGSCGGAGRRRGHRQAARRQHGVTRLSPPTRHPPTRHHARKHPPAHPPAHPTPHGPSPFQPTLSALEPPVPPARSGAYLRRLHGCPVDVAVGLGRHLQDGELRL